MQAEDLHSNSQAHVKSGMVVTCMEFQCSCRKWKVEARRIPRGLKSTQAIETLSLTNWKDQHSRLFSDLAQAVASECPPPIPTLMNNLTDSKKLNCGASVWEEGPNPNPCLFSQWCMLWSVRQFIGRKARFGRRDQTASNGTPLRGTLR